MQTESAQRAIEYPTSEQPDDGSAANELIRSMALSSAELWHDILQRLDELHQSQIALVRAVTQLGTLVETSLAAGVAPSLTAATPVGQLGPAPVEAGQEDGDFAGWTPLRGSELEEPASPVDEPKRRRYFRSRKNRAKAAKASTSHADLDSRARGEADTRRFGFAATPPPPTVSFATLPPPPSFVSLPPPPVALRARLTPPAFVAEAKPSFFIDVEPVEPALPVRAKLTEEPVVSEAYPSTVSAPTDELPIVPAPLVYTPSNTETLVLDHSTSPLPGATVLSVSEAPAAVIEAPAQAIVEAPAAMPFTLDPVEAQPEPTVARRSSALARRSGRPVEDVRASLASEILGSGLLEPSAQPSTRPALEPVAVSDDLTLRSKRRKRLQFRLR